MKYISSDTNVWIDFMTINRIALPFRLPYKYIMNQEAIEDELLSPPDFKSQLLDAGLISTELTDEEFFLAAEYGQHYKKTLDPRPNCSGHCEVPWNYITHR